MGLKSSEFALPILEVSQVPPTTADNYHYFQKKRKEDGMPSFKDLLVAPVQQQ